MSLKNRQKLSLDRQIAYQIKVPGELNINWADQTGDITNIFECDESGFSISTLTGTFDQAALQGLLRRLYSRGIPLISVICLDYV